MGEQTPNEHNMTVGSTEPSHEVGRRGFIKTAAVAAAAAGLVAQGGAEKAAAQPAPTGQAGRKFKIIDFRNRPPLKPFKGLFDLKANYLMQKRLNSINRGANTAMPSMALEGIGTPAAMDLWWKEIDAAGISAVVVNGRYAAGLADFTMDNDTLAQLQDRYKGRLFGLSQVNLDQDPAKTAQEVEKAIKQQGLKGANLEPGYQTKGIGKMGTFTDDPSFWPILEVLAATGAFLLIQTGLFAGTDIWFNNPPALDRMLQSFPTVNVVLAHGGYPYVLEMLGLANKHPQLYLSPDVYMFWPGGQLYQMNLSLLPDQFVFGSAYPFCAMNEIVQDTLTLRDNPLARVSDEVMEKYLSGNAARLLKI
jgi:predicted TIM-barrel fold metal-dependent hydrolase